MGLPTTTNFSWVYDSFVQARCHSKWEKTFMEVMMDAVPEKIWKCPRCGGYDMLNVVVTSGVHSENKKLCGQCYRACYVTEPKLVHNPEFDTARVRSRSGKQAFQERVMDERAELGKKLEKLRDFLGGMQYASLPRIEQHLLSHQYITMRTYIAILNDRIARFKEE